MFNPTSSYKKKICFELSNDSYNEGKFICDKYGVKIEDCNSVVIDSTFNKYLYGIPDNIKYIETCHSNCVYNKPLNNFPKYLEELDIIRLVEFNNKLDNLPSTLKVLSIGGIYSHPLDNLPEGLQELRVGGNYECKLKKLPKNLETLYLKHDFNQELNDPPSGLKHLIISESSKYVGSLNNLPYGLKTLIISSNYIYDLNNLPVTLKKIRINNKKSNNANIKKYNFEYLPENLDCLEIETHETEDFTLDNLPCNLRKLIFKTGIYNQKLNNLPANLKVLNLSFMKEYNGEDLILPQNLQTLNIYSKNQIKIHYPSSLKSLSINGSLFSVNKSKFEKLSQIKILEICPDSGNDNISINLPNSLKYFKQFYIGNLTIVNNLPDSLEYFIVGQCFNQEIKYFPPNLKVFYIDNPNYKYQIDNLPSGLEKLYYSVNSNHHVSNLPSGLKYLYLSTKIMSLKKFYPTSESEFVNPPLPTNLEYFGFNPIFTKDRNSDDNDYEEYKSDEYELCWLVINNISDSVKFLSMEFDIDDFEFTRLPNNLEEISINNRHLTNGGFNCLEHFKSNGCINDFNKVYIEETEDYSDIRSFNNCIKRKFDVFLDDEYDVKTEEDKKFIYNY